MPTAITHDPIFNTPVSSTNTAVVRWSGTTGSTLQDCGVLIDGSNNLIIPAQGDLRLSDTSGGQYVAFQANGTTTTHTLTFPAAQGSASTVLTNDGAGALTWAAAGGGIASVVADTTPQLGGNLDMQARLLVGNGGSTGIAISANGEVTMAAQPAVAFYNSTDDVDQTGSSQTATIDFDTEVFDQNSDFANDTFTAPVDGRYAVHTQVEVSDISATTQYIIRLTASNRTWRLLRIIPTAIDESGGILGMGGSAIIDMDAHDYFVIKLQATGEAGNVIDITGGSNPQTHVSVSLVA